MTKKKEMSIQKEQKFIDVPQALELFLKRFAGSETGFTGHIPHEVMFKIQEHVALVFTGFDPKFSLIHECQCFLTELGFPSEIKSISNGRVRSTVFVVHETVLVPSAIVKKALEKAAMNLKSN